MTSSLRLTGIFECNDAPFASMQPLDGKELSLIIPVHFVMTVDRTRSRKKQSHQLKRVDHRHIKRASQWSPLVQHFLCGSNIPVSATIIHNQLFF